MENIKRIKIIGISGRRQSGKTTTAEYIVDNYEGRAEIVCFADEIKDIICRCFGAGTNDLWGSNAGKERVLPCGKTGRELLQIVGTDWFRGLDPDCWLRAYKMRVERVSHYAELIVTPDVRFHNEIKLIQKMGGHVARLMLRPYPKDVHGTEIALDETEKETWSLQQKDLLGKALHLGGRTLFNRCINNRYLSLEAKNMTVWDLINERGWL